MDIPFSETMASSNMHVSPESIAFNNNEKVQMQVGVQNVYGATLHDNSRVNRKRRFSDIEVAELDDSKFLIAQIRIALKVVNPAIVSSLSFPEMLDRRTSVRQPHPGTCEWIWQHVEFVQWSSLSTGFLWVTGKAGAGKSTMMSYLYDSFCDQRDETTGIYLDFFFSSKGVNLQKTPLGMLRSLLYQLFLSSDSVRTRVRSYYQRDHARLHTGNFNRTWQRFELEKLLQTAILEAAKEKPVIVFVDALDETGDVFAREIFTYLHDINDQATNLGRLVKICVSSRPYPSVTKISVQQVHVDQCNGNAISLFVGSLLNLKTLLNCDDPDQEEWQSIKSTIIEQANGLFQWAQLVASLVQSKISDGESPAAIHRWLSDVPPELDTVYTHILQQIIQRGHQTQSLFLFQCVIFAKVPISLSEIRYALAAHDAPLHYCERYEDLQGFVKSDESMAKLIKTWAGSLIEVNKPDRYRGGYRDLNTGWCHVLQVAHKSIQDFLLNKGLYMLSSNYESFVEDLCIHQSAASNMQVTRIAYKALYRTCLVYIEHECSLYTVWSYSLPALKMRSPFMLHSSAILLFYAQRALCDNVDSIAEEARAIQRIYATWTSIIKQLEDVWNDPDQYIYGKQTSIIKQLEDTKNDPNQYIHDTHNPLLFYVACAANLSQIVSHFLHEQDWTKDSDDNGKSGMHVAAAYGATDSAIVLHKAGFDLSAMTEAGDTPLSLAATYHREEFCHWLLEEGAMSSTRSKALQAALCPAAEAGNLSLVQSLLHSGANVNMLGKNRFGQVASALHFAAAAGHDEVTKYLLDQGAAANRSLLNLGHVMDRLCHPLEGRPAAMRILRLLLDAGADVNAYDGDSGIKPQAVAVSEPIQEFLQLSLGKRYSWHTPIATAVSIQDKEMVQLLLRHGADPNICRPGWMGHRDRNILRSSSEILQLLISAVIRFGESDEARQENLNTAAAHNHTEIVEALLESGTDLSLPKPSCDSALHRVASSGSLSMARLLLAKGANVNAQCDPFMKTALFEAVRSGKSEMAELLLSNGANPFTRDVWGSTMLHAVVEEHVDSSKMIKWLIDLGLSLETQNSFGSTPLHNAIFYDRAEIARNLLSLGASSNTRDIYGRSPFDIARSRGDFDLMRVMKNGSHVVEEDSDDIRPLVLQRSIVSLATSLLDEKYRALPFASGFYSLGMCLLRLGKWHEARQCFQNDFRCRDSIFTIHGICDICEEHFREETLQTCTTCYTEVCQKCFSFLKCKESAFGKCYDHDFLIVPAPSLSDFTLWSTGTVPPLYEDMRGAIMDKNRQLLVDLINRYSKVE